MRNLFIRRFDQLPTIWLQWNWCLLPSPALSQLTKYRRPPLKWQNLCFWFKKMLNVLKRIKKQFSDFFVFEIWLVLYSKYLEIPKYHQKWPIFILSQKMRTVLKLMQNKSSDFCNYIFFDMLDFVLKILRKLTTISP